MPYSEMLKFESTTMYILNHNQPDTFIDLLKFSFRSKSVSSESYKSSKLNAIRCHYITGINLAFPVIYLIEPLRQTF